MSLRLKSSESTVRDGSPIDSADSQSSRNKLVSFSSRKMIISFNPQTSVKLTSIDTIRELRNPNYAKPGRVGLN